MFNKNTSNAKVLNEIELDGTTKSGSTREREPILDFLGNPFDYGAIEPEPEIDESNMIELMQMSRNNQFFLFIDRSEKRFLLYELKPR